jgi:protein-disulfide isomerase
MISVPRMVVVIATLLALPVAAAAQSFTPGQRQEIEGIIKDYLISHPEVMQDVQAALEKRQAEAEVQKAHTAIDKNNATLFNSPHQVVLGNPNGKVTMVEFFDYNCPHCKDAVSDMLDLLKTDHDLRFVLKEFPILTEGSVEAAHVAVAVRMQDPTGAKYLAFHKELFTSRGMVDQARALSAAKDVGCDMARVKKDMNSDEVKATLAENMKLADALGVNGTPSYVIGDRLLVGQVGVAELQRRITTLEK